MKMPQLRTIWRRYRGVPGLKRNLAVLAVVVILGLAAAGSIVMNQGFTAPWSERFVFSADFKEAPAVKPDSKPKVRLAGVDVGEITDSKVVEGGRARLTFSLEPGQRIYDNARLVLRANNPINEMYVEINPGGPPGRSLRPNSVIPVSQTERPVQVDEVLAHLDQRTRNGLSDLLAESDTALAHASTQLPGGLNSLDDTMHEFGPVMDALQTRRDKIRKLVTALAQISAATGGNNNRLARLTDSTQQALSVLAGQDDKLADTLRQMPGLSARLREAMGRTGQLAGQLNPTLHDLNHASRELPPALSRLSEATDQIGHTVREAKPVVAKARPVVADLRPLVGDVHAAFDDVQPISGRLDHATGTLVPYLNDLSAFIFNTSSVFSLGDANGGFVRGQVTVPLPDGGVVPGGNGGFVPGRTGGK